jgi:hypothetical protein
VAQVSGHQSVEADISRCDVTSDENIMGDRCSRPADDLGLVPSRDRDPGIIRCVPRVWNNTWN